MNMEKLIQDLLEKSLAPADIAVRNDSHLHAGHASSPGTGESHFTVTIITERFTGLNRVRRHQMVYEILKPLMNNPIHALAIHTLTPEEKKD